MRVPGHLRQFELWINGELAVPENCRYITPISPSHESPVTRVPEGGFADVNKAVAVAKSVFESVKWSAGQCMHAAALSRHLYGQSCNTLGSGTMAMTLRAI